MTDGTNSRDASTLSRLVSYFENREPSGTFLTREEIEELTGKSKPSAQARALQEMHVKFACRPDGKNVVLRSHVEAVLSSPSSTKLRNARTEPNLRSVR